MVCSDQQEQVLSSLADQWLLTAHHEGFLLKKVTVTHACITTDGKAYINFDQSLFDQQQSTRDKFFLIQGLLKTIKEAGITVTGIYFLTDNKPLDDYHLDFSIAWSLEPYTN